MLAFFCTSKKEEFTVILQFRPLFALLPCILNFVCAFLTTLENFFVFYALWKASSITFSLRKLFLSLAFTDLAVGLCVQPMLAAIMVLLLARAARENYNFDFLCPSILTVNAFFAYALLAACFFTIAAIALDRFIAVTLHLRYQELATDKRVNIAIVIIWLTSGLASFALIATSSNNYLNSVVIQILGLSVLTVAYFRIFENCASSSKSNTEPASDSKWPSNGNTQRKKVGFECFVCLYYFTNLLPSKYICFHPVNC